MRKSQMWTLALALAAAVNGPMPSEDDEAQDRLRTDAESVGTEPVSKGLEAAGLEFQPEEIAQIRDDESEDSA